MDDATPSFHTEKNREEDIFNIIFSEGPKRAVEKYLHVLNQEEGYEKFVKYLILERCEASKISQWLSWLCLCGDPDTIIEELKKKSGSQVCGRVFKDGDITYHCRTCGVDNTCVICAECFKYSDHTGHDWYTHQTSAGGCCDCGDAEAWNPAGNCKFHRGPSEESDPTLTLPDTLKRSLSRIVSTTFQILSRCLYQRENYFVYPSSLLKKFKSSSSEKSQRYVTLLYNDDEHTFDEVINALVKGVPNCTSDEALNFAIVVDAQDSAVVMVGTETECKEAAQPLEEIGLRVEIKSNCIIVPSDMVDALLEWFDEFCSHNDGLRRVVANELIKNITFTTTATSQQQPTTESQTSQLSTTSTATTTMTMLECFMRSYNSLRPDSKLKMQAFFFQLMRDMFFKKIFAIHFTNLYKDLAKYYTRGIIEFDETLLTFSVQLLTMPTFSTILAKEHKLVDVLLESVQHALTLTIQNGKINFLHSIFEDNRIDVLIHHLEYVLNLEGVCDYIFTSRMDLFFNFIKLFEPLQYALAEVRRKTDHVLFDTKEWARGVDLAHSLFTAFFLLLPRLGKHIKDNTLTLSPNFGFKTVLSSVLSEIENRLILWFSDPVSEVKESIEICNPWLLPSDNNKIEVLNFDMHSKPISFHIPLQRLFAAVVMTALEAKPNEFTSLEAFLETTTIPMNKLLQFLLEHPLRINVLVAQNKFGLWIRNGISILSQIFHYKSRSFRQHFFELDLNLMQMVCCLIPPTQFLVILLHRFELLDWFTKEQFQLNCQKDRKLSEKDKENLKFKMGMVEEFFYLIIWILTERSHICQNRETKRILRREIIHRLWLKKHTASELKRSIPSSLFETKEFDRIIGNVATFHQPKGKEQGAFELKVECVDEFDPFFAFYTNEERENAKEKLREIIQKKIQKNGDNAVQDPPVILTDLLPAFTPLRQLYHSPVLHHLVFDVLHNFTPSLLHQCLHLIQLAIIETPQITNDFFSLTRPFDPEQENDTILTKLVWLKKQKEHSTYHPFIQWIFNKLKERNEHLREVIQQLTEPKGTHTKVTSITTTSMDAKEERRRKALEARQRIMQKIQKQQTAFLEKHKDELAGLNKDLDSPMEEVKERDRTKDEKMSDEKKETKEEECILCRELLNINPVERPWGAIALAQPSQLLFLPLQPALRQKFVLNAKEFGVYIHFCGHYLHFDCYDKYYNSLRQRRNQLLFEGIVLDVERGEFLCPLCKQVGNTVIPIAPSPPSQLVVGTVESDDNKMAVEPTTTTTTTTTITTTETIQQRQIPLQGLNLSLSKNEVLNSEVKALDTKWIDFLRPLDFSSIIKLSISPNNSLTTDPIFNQKSQNLSSAIEAFALRVCCEAQNTEFPDQDMSPFNLLQKLTASLAYTVATLELAARNTSLSTSTTTNNNNNDQGAQSNDLLFDFESVVKEKEQKLLKSFADVILAFTFLNYNDSEHTKKLASFHFELTDPAHVVLSHNCVSRLYEHILMITPLLFGTRSSNTSVTRQQFIEYFRTSVSFYFFVQLAQALIVQNFSPYCTSSDKDPTFRYFLHENSLTETELRHSLTILENTLISQLLIQHSPTKFEEEMKLRNSQQDPNFYGKVLALTLPFLRCAALLYSILFSQKIPSFKRPSTEKGLYTLEIEHWLDSMGIPKLHVLLTESEMKNSMLKLWAAQISTKILAFTQSVSKSNTQAEGVSFIANWNEFKSLLFQIVPPLLNLPEPFELWPLPNDYTEILQNWMQASCEKCNRVPDEPSLCLICGKLCCTGSICCREQEQGECMYHTRKCGSQVPFLLVRKAGIMIFNSRCGFMYSSPYLDAYGEEDPGLRRGRPLKLNLERYQQLRLLVLQHKIGTTKERTLRNPHLL